MSADKCVEETIPLWLALPLLIVIVAAAFLMVTLCVALWREYM